MTFHRLKNITPLPDFMLRAEFLDGSHRSYSSDEIYENGMMTR